jgi:hypothetical protein
LIFRPTHTGIVVLELHRQPVTPIAKHNALKLCRPRALLAQWLERSAVNRKVTGSIPVGSGYSWSGYSCHRIPVKKIANDPIHMTIAHPAATSVCGLVVRIAGFHPAGPGSIPGSRSLLVLNFITKPRNIGNFKKILEKRSKADLNRHRWIQSPEC